MQINEIVSKSPESDHELRQAISQFVHWVIKKLDIQDELPKFDLSYDQLTAQKLHRTGSYEWHNNIMTVYVLNRNLVDILRTVAHEMTHKKQAEEGRIHQKNPPGSKLEQEADATAGYLMKLYSKEHREIFQ